MVSVCVAQKDGIDTTTPLLSSVKDYLLLLDATTLEIERHTEIDEHPRLWGANLNAAATNLVATSMYSEPHHLMQ